MRYFSQLFSLVFLVLSLCNSSEVKGQEIRIITSDSVTSFRGLSVVDDDVVWVSGNKGRVGRSTDGGKSWSWMRVKGAEDRDFRDIEAFDKNTAVIISVSEPALIFKTADGGQSWKEVYRNPAKGMFLDALEFWNDESGIVLGDPIDGHFFIARSFDGGETWSELSRDLRPRADSGEACFAASGTNIRAISRSEAAFVTGGRLSRLFTKSQPVTIPLIQGKETTGANSFAVFKPKKYRSGKRMVVVGGDFAADTSSEKNCFITDDGGKTWNAPATPPRGYKSCVEYLSKFRLISCGTSGVDVSENGGYVWRQIDTSGYHVVRKAKKGNAVFLAGAKGRIARLEW